MEDDLLSVRKEFSMEGEEVHGWDSSWKSKSNVEERKEHEGVVAGDKTSEGAEEHVIDNSSSDQTIGLVWLIEEQAVFMSLNSSKAVLMALVMNSFVVEDESCQPQDPFVLQALKQ